jgi:hypothetical protein
MQLKDLAEFFAVLTILEPDAKICKITAKLATAGTATEGLTDMDVIKEIMASMGDLEKELATISDKKLQLKQKVLAKILTPSA